MDRSKIYLSIIITLLLWGLGFVYFLYHTNNIKNENRNITDVIMTPGVGKERMFVGGQLLKAGYAPIMYIIGDKPMKTYESFIEAQGFIKEQFLFDTDLAAYELTQAKNAFAFMKKYDFLSARIIVYPYQVPRANLLFSHRIFNEMQMIVHSTPQKNVDISKIFMEYLKFNLTFLAYLIGVQHELDLSYS